MKIVSASDIVVIFLRDFQAEIQWAKFPHNQNSDILNEIDFQIEAVVEQFRFLTLFEDCIHKWIDDDFGLPRFQFLSIKIKPAVQKIRNEVLFKDVFSNFQKELKEMEEYSESFRETASRLLLLLTKFDEEIDLLKPEIEEVVKGLSVQYFPCNSPMYFLDEWESFVSSLLACLVKVEDQYNSSDSRKKQAQDVYHILYSLRSLLCGFPVTVRYEDFSIYVAEVSIRAALVCCYWWSRDFGQNLKEDVNTSFADLRKRIIFTDLDQILRRLKTADATYTHIFWPKGEEVRMFVNYLLPFRRRFESFSGRSFRENAHLLPFRFIKELESLTFSIVKDLKISEEDFNKEGSFFQDFKLLILEAEESFCSCLTENGTSMLNLLGKLWLMKMEIFLLTAADELKLFNRLHIDPLIDGMRQIISSSVEIGAQTLAVMEDVAKLIAAVHHSFQVRKVSKDMVRAILLLLLTKILLFKLDRKIQDYNEISVLLFKDKMGTYLEGSQFLINCLINQQEALAKEGELELARVETMARRVIAICYSIPSSNIDEQMVQNINLMLSNLGDEVKFVMTKLREIYFPVPISNFPKTNALGFYDALLTKLREFLVCFEGNFFEFVKQYIGEILAYLELFRNCLGDILKLAEEIQELRSLGKHVIDVAYEAEYVVDLIVVREESECHNLIWLYHLLQNIRQIKMQVIKVNDRKTYDAKVHNLPQTSGHVVSKTATRRMDDIMLCLNDQQELIIDRLLGGYPQQETVAIVGMPGIGKTTLAKQVYNCPKVAHHFHVRAWCCVTEVYRKRELLLEILSHIVAITDNINQLSNEDLDLKLRQFLLRRKYLIVIDDIWSTVAWNDLQRSFPENENGSRILITSRLNDIALNAKPHYKPVKLRLLSDVESWDLLQLKIFGNDRCPKELIEVGQRIAKSCRGLPLAVVAMAGLLERTEKKQNKWKEIEETLISRIVNDPLEQCHKMLELSYKLLPDHLKACFLYFGAFLEDQEISVTKLIRLWIAEGFVQKNELKGLEDLAEDYLKDLIGRSLVIFAHPRSLGGTKACRVHDMLRNLCQSKAKEDNFLQVITRSNGSFDDLDFVVDVNSTNSSDCRTYGCHRLSFYSTRNYFTEMKPFGPLVRSLLFFAKNNKYARSSYDISFISCSFRLLKVLDLESINMGPSFPSGIELMLHLRYLAVSGDIESVPSSIANLSNLETFIVKGLKGKVKIPDGIWHLKRLRHLHVSDVAFFCLLHDEIGTFSLLEYLVTLSSPLLRHDERTISMLKKCPNLRKMACIFSESSNGDGTCNIFPRLDVLTHLESLRITYYGRNPQTAEFSFPFSLKKLTLSNFCLPWKHISVIGRLPNLQVLKLLSRSCDGEVWDMVEGEFCNLRFLKLDTLNLAQWNASSDSLPCLQQLVLRNCKHLVEVPYSFVEIPTLQMIEIQWCSKSAEESVRRMREEADELLRVVIFTDLDFKSASTI